MDTPVEPAPEPSDPVWNNFLKAANALKDQRDKAEEWHNNRLKNLWEIARELLCGPTQEEVLGTIRDLRSNVERLLVKVDELKEYTACLEYERDCARQDLRDERAQHAALAATLLKERTCHPA